MSSKTLPEGPELYCVLYCNDLYCTATELCFVKNEGIIKSDPELTNVVDSGPSFLIPPFWDTLYIYYII